MTAGGKDETDAEALAALLTAAHLSADYELPELLRRHVRAFGGTDAVIFLSDLQQSVLVPFLGEREPPAGVPLEPLPVDSTLAGRAFQHVEMLTQQRGDHDTVLWLPLLDGTERLGVLAVGIPDQGPDPREVPGVARLGYLASLLGELIMTKTMYGDTIVRARRRSDMGLAAEMQWSLLPPLTFATPSVTIAGVLEPAYEVAGDTIDYAVDSGMARMAVFDGMGHGLLSAQLAAMAISAYRHSRRGGDSLVETCAHIHQALIDTRGGKAFTTAVLGELDTTDGTLRWLNAGHPEPLLMRHGRLVKSLHAPPRPPLGVPLAGTPWADGEPSVGVEHLEPGDCVLFFTDGVTEARSPDGDFFGEQRLVDLVVRNMAAGLPAPETMRRVVRALLEHQRGRLSDDASLLLVQWPTAIEAMLP